jgi:hypothetical protein
MGRSHSHLTGDYPARNKDQVREWRHSSQYTARRRSRVPHHILSTLTQGYGCSQTRKTGPFLLMGGRRKYQHSETPPFTLGRTLTHGGVVLRFGYCPAIMVFSVNFPNPPQCLGGDAWRFGSSTQPFRPVVNVSILRAKRQRIRPCIYLRTERTSL